MEFHSYIWDQSCWAFPTEHKMIKFSIDFSFHIYMGYWESYWPSLFLLAIDHNSYQWGWVIALENEKMVNDFFFIQNGFKRNSMNLRCPRENKGLTKIGITRWYGEFLRNFVSNNLNVASLKIWSWFEAIVEFTHKMSCFVESLNSLSLYLLVWLL